MNTNDHQVEKYVLMWNDPTVNSTEEIRKAQQSLVKNFNQLNTYETVDKCKNAIRQLSTTSRVILIISGTFDLCKKKLKVNQMDRYGDDMKCDILYKLHLELFSTETEFKKQQDIDSRIYSPGFEMFFNLLQEPKSRLAKLNLLSMELKKEAIQKLKDKKTLQFYEQLSIEIHWRNVIINSNNLTNIDQQILITSYRDYIIEGNPFEIIDGDNFEMQDTFLNKVFQLFQDKKFFIITTIGPENSGKSTLLNFLFGTLFETRDGRCIYGSLINIQNIRNKDKLIPLDYDYILVIDTEGILSALKNDEQYDKRLILFCLAVSHLVIVNIDSRIDESVKNIFVICTQALKYLQETRVKRPTVHFVFNKRPTSNESYCKELFETVRTTLKTNELDNEIDLKSENIHILSTAFNRKPLEISEQNCAALQTDKKFVENIQKFCKTIIDNSSEIVRENGDLFCIPTSWIQHASRVLETIKKHPDLIHFQHAYEREKYNDIRDDIRRDFELYVSPALTRCLMNNEKQNDIDTIKNSFKREYECCLENLEEKLQIHCKKKQALGNIFKRSLRFMEIQLTNIFQSWQIAAIMASEKNKIDQTIHDIEEKLRKKVISITHENYFKDEKLAIEMFNNEFKEIFIEIENKFNSENVWKQSIAMVSHLYDILVEVIVMPNNDENVAIDVTQGITQTLSQLFQPKIKEIFDKSIEDNGKNLNRFDIIKELDDQARNATDDEWLKLYVLEPVKLIMNRFNEKWAEIKLKLNEKFNMIIKVATIRLNEIFELLEKINTILRNQEAHSTSFVNRLFETATINYLGLFLDTCLNLKDDTKQKLLNRINSFIQTTYSAVEQQLTNRTRGCEISCPCCKRICDVDHYLDLTSPVGQGDNRHRCQLGHQIRGMGGVRYEKTNEASMVRCQFVKDNDRIVTDNNILKIWKDFKNYNCNWDFESDLNVDRTLSVYIWDRIGQQLCDHYGNEMKFVTENTPLPVNHFIFMLDHSGSMNEKNRTRMPWIFSFLTNSSDETNLTPWEYLLQVLKAFLDIRIRLASLNDQITIILFDNRAARIYNREKLCNIDINSIKLPMDVCERGTSFSTAFQLLLKAVIFITDGQSQDHSTTELRKLCDYRTDVTANQNHKASINNFWTMAHGDFDRRIIEEVNQTIQGQIVKIETAKELIERYVQIAEIL
ncbi:hypothetical protein I4U23_027276 [Adineta vaga]|nr:hypothetical protein I4U23_027276 [Adineta vaga]